MSEYKLLKDFGELVPGMIFQNYTDEKIHIIWLNDLWVRYILDDSTCGVSIPRDAFTRPVKLIHDPRPVQKTIQEKISEHKLQIEILEKELAKESLKSLLEIGSVYRISDISDRSYICKVLSLNDLSFDYMTTEDNSTRLLRYVEVKKIFKICSLEDMFKYFCPIYEKKV